MSALPVLMIVPDDVQALRLQRLFNPRVMVVVPMFRGPMQQRFRAAIVRTPEKMPRDFEKWLTEVVRPALAPEAMGAVTYF